MTATWPAISGIQYDTVSVQPLDQRSVFTTDAGNPKTASLSTTAQFVVRFDVIFTGNELQTFWGWWEDNLQLGADDFDGLEDVVDAVSARYKFVSMPAFTIIRGGGQAVRLWRASFELWKVA